MKGELHVSVGKGNKMFWGLLFLLGAVTFLVSKLGFLEGIGFWSILFTIGLVAMLINGLVERSFGIILFSLAFLVIVNDEFLHLEEITPWPVLGAALLGTMGLNLMFPGFHRGKRSRGNMGSIGSGGTAAGGAYKAGNVVSLENTFGRSVKYVTGEISVVNLDSACGVMEVYFNDAVLKDHAAYVCVDGTFGKVILYVPRSWRVVNNASAPFGSVESDCGSGSSDEDTLYVSGNVAFGVLQIEVI